MCCVFMLCRYMSLFYAVEREGEFKRGTFNLCQKSTDPSEWDRAEGLESTYLDHKKHVRTAKSVHMERQARTHSQRSNSLGGLGVAEERPLLN